jgi:hypothetical protein
MNRKLAVIAAIAAAAATSAFADDITADSTSYVGSKTRAEVQAELAAYKKAGVNPWSTQYNPLKDWKGSLTRGQVVGEFLTSRNEVTAFIGEDSGSAYLAGRTPEVRVQIAGEPAARRQ